MTKSTIALQGGRDQQVDYEQQVNDFMGYVTDSLPDNHPLYGLKARPIPEGRPEVWLLGSSFGSAAVAAAKGTALAFAHFLNSEGGDTKAEAERLAMTLDLFLHMIVTGQHTEGMPTYEMARDYPYSERDRAIIRENRSRMIVGDPTSVRQKLTAFAKRYGVEEVIVSTLGPRVEDRLRTIELLADAMDLSPTSTV
jgi:alkanesulfonate monooxygenase SsuD/methylene tetrahydromethanopterin reductase-like flavin-dependent oxidoreductase (luciferase family)